MKILTNIELISVGNFRASLEFQHIYDEIRSAILTVSWADPYMFIINPVKRGNGVVPIKDNFIAHLLKNGWHSEVRMNIVKGMRPGPIDAIKQTSSGIVAVEWETGNISSSHRSLNKMAIGILQKQIIAGFLVLPHKALAQYLTDRVGNYEEIEPYFPLYASLKIENGHIGVLGIEHDSVSGEVVLIPKGKDGNAIK
ncbi:MAG: restriction endonuclease [Saprospiraceae bacterium]|nr:restriction endonuclease [Saprospiraceae bacterium]